MKVQRRRRAIALLKSVLGFGLLAASLWGVDWTAFSQSFTRLSFAWMVALFLLVLLSLLLKTLRSYLLLHNFQVSLSFSRVLEAFFLGQAASTLLPSRGGEVLRLAYLTAEDVSRFPQVAAAVMLEKFLDLLAMTFLALVVSANLPLMEAVRVRFWLLPLSAAGVVVLLVLIAGGPGVWRRLRAHWAGRGPAWLDRWLRFGDRMVESSLWLRSPRRLLPAVGWTVVIWGAMWGTNAALFRALELRLPLTAGGLVLVLVYIGVLPALMPANIGPFYFFAQLGVSAFGVLPADAAAFAVILHAVVTLTPLLAAAVIFIFSAQARAVLFRSAPDTGG